MAQVPPHETRTLTTWAGFPWSRGSIEEGLVFYLGGGVMKSLWIKERKDPRIALAVATVKKRKLLWVDNSKAFPQGIWLTRTQCKKLSDYLIKIE
jgi:hypothetical protein